MNSKLDYKTFTSELESHWMPHSYGLVLHLSKVLSKLVLFNPKLALGGITIVRLEFDLAYK